MMLPQETVWLDEAHAYTVTTVLGTVGRPEQCGLSHVEAMRVAEGLWRGGEVAIVMHVIGDRRSRSIGTRRASTPPQRF